MPRSFTAGVLLIDAIISRDWRTMSVQPAMLVCTLTMSSSVMSQTATPVVIAVALEHRHVRVERLHTARSLQSRVDISLEDEERHLLQEVGGIDPAFVPVQHIVPQDLRLRYPPKSCSWGGGAPEADCRRQG